MNNMNNMVGRSAAAVGRAVDVGPVGHPIRHLLLRAAPSRDERTQGLLLSRPRPAAIRTAPSRAPVARLFCLRFPPARPSRVRPAPRAAPERKKIASHVGHMLRRVHGHDVSRFWRDLLGQFFAFALTVSVLPLSHTCSSSLDPHSQAPAGLRTDVTSPVRTTYGRFVATVGPRLSRPRPGCVASCLPRALCVASCSHCAAAVGAAACALLHTATPFRACRQPRATRSPPSGTAALSRRTCASRGTQGRNGPTTYHHGHGKSIVKKPVPYRSNYHMY